MKANNTASIFAPDEDEVTVAETDGKQMKKTASLPVIVKHRGICLRHSLCRLC